MLVKLSTVKPHLVPEHLHHHRLNWLYRFAWQHFCSTTADSFSFFARNLTKRGSKLHLMQTFDAPGSPNAMAVILFRTKEARIVKEKV